ncbi:hypothetical protein CDD80_6383 [Ophiocordyceps camponoti-rufipedis]|uniref:BZIP domain-containing protein n=1 Tax=Ophiocordyceps camponoti-rufipedis TaxID=2004952 RepID=A0A2C5YQV1_9HYPO|nr:hypothetical protein CDD80_6383 [Ophiocordyceps camponoti-rufipedis]
MDHYLGQFQQGGFTSGAHHHQQQHHQHQHQHQQVFEPFLEPLPTVITHQFDAGESEDIAECNGWKADAAQGVFEVDPRAFDFVSNYQQQQQQQQQHHHPQQLHHPFVDPPTPPSSTVGAAVPFGPHLPPPRNALGAVLQRGSDEEEVLTPAQARRKTQNRRAQRAFRERREKYQRDLEAEIAHQAAQLADKDAENQLLRRNNQAQSNELEILRAAQVANQATLSPTAYHHHHHHHSNTTDGVVVRRGGSPGRRRARHLDRGQKLLSSDEAWDVIISHPDYRRGLVDLGDVGDRLKAVLRFDGTKPAFEEEDVLGAIGQSVGCGSDDLL